MRIKRLFFCALLSLTSLTCHAQSICLTSGEWPPYMEAKLPHGGPLSLIIEQAFALEGVEVRWQFYPWARAMLMAQSGRCDGTAVWSSSAKRLAAFYLSDPIISNQTYFLHRNSQPFDWHSISDLGGLAIGGTIGYDYGDSFQEAERTGQLKVIRLPQEQQGIRMLLAKRLDAFPIDKVTAQAMLRQDFSREQRASLSLHPQALRTDPLHLLLNRNVAGNQEMLEKFNRGLTRLKQSGAYDRTMSLINLD